MTNALRAGGDRAASVALILASLSLAGCTADPQEESGTGPGGREPAHSTYEHAGADNVVVLVTDRALEAGAERLGFDVSTTATFVLLGNGTAIVPGELDSEPVGGTYPPYPESCRLDRSQFPTTRSSGCSGWPTTSACSAEISTTAI